MRYVKARIIKEDHDMTYRIYVTDSLKAIGGFDIRYYDLISDKPVETRSSEEIINHIKNELDNLE